MEGLSAEHTKKGRLQRACLDLLWEHEADGALPTSNRFLFYELVSRGALPKSYPGKKRTPAQDVSEATTRLREVSIIPWSWIVDETRALHDWRYASSVRQYALDGLPSARIDLWAGEPPPLILCESRSLAGVLQDIASTYLCPIAATNGQVGGFLHTDVGPLIREGGVFATRRVLYFGDLDLSGGHIEENTRGVLEAYAPLDWTRLAITNVQVRERGLTVVEKKDNRFKPARTFPAVETEALRQREIQRILLEVLEETVPQPLSEVLEREKRQRVQVRERLSGDE
jgi:hypothetical protein